MIRLSLVGLLAFISSSCSVETEEKVGPNGSWWLGGADGGVYVKVQDDENPNDDRYLGTIYFEYNHTVWYSGGLVLKNHAGQFSPDDQ